MYEEIKGESVDMLIPAEKIAARVSELAAEITRDFEGKSVTLLCTLKGAAYFFTDLTRQIPLLMEVDFVKASSYGDSTHSSGAVQMDILATGTLAGRNIILVEDIIDTGHTVAYLCNYLQARRPASFRVCSLLDKPERREVQDINIDYLGFTIPDKFVVGYGLDYAQRYRNLPYIGVLKFESEAEK